MKPAERDELLTEVYELLLAQDEKIDALGQMLKREREVTRQTLAHCERLVKKDEDMQRAMGIYGLVRRANEEHGSAPRDGAFAGFWKHPAPPSDPADYWPKDWWNNGSGGCGVGGCRNSPAFSRGRYVYLPVCADHFHHNPERVCAGPEGSSKYGNGCGKKALGQYEIAGGHTVWLCADCLKESPSALLKLPDANRCAHEGCNAHAIVSLPDGRSFCNSHVNGPHAPLSTPGRAAQDTLHKLGERIKKL